jgi:hypothetical protein
VKRALVIGGYGTFGSIICKQLHERGVAVTVAGRDARQAEALARTLGGVARGLAVDIRDQQGLREALTDHHVVVNCSGPFDAFSSRNSLLLQSCVDMSTHYVDIADDRAWCAGILDWHERFHERERAAVFGCSSFPGISGALALVARNGGEPPVGARVTLFIGNDNPKGAAAIRSAVSVIGTRIPAPQGELRGFGGAEIVTLPSPFGTRRVHDFNSPEYDLFGALLGVRSVRVKVGFELASANLAFAFLSLFGARFGDRTARVLYWIGGISRGKGYSGGVVQVDLFDARGACRTASASCASGAQPMAALPATLITAGLLEGTVRASGVKAPYEAMAPEHLLGELERAGFTIKRP